MIIEIYEDEFEEWQVSEADKTLIKYLSQEIDPGIYKLDLSNNLAPLFDLSAEGLGFLFQMVFELGVDVSTDDLVKDVINTLQKRYGVHYVN